jgi:hypothetical protein
MKRLLSVFIIGLLVVLTVSGCSKTATPTTSSSQIPAETRQTTLTSQPASTQRTSLTPQTTATLSSQETPQSSPTTVTSNIRGDVNQDGVVDMGDTLAVEKMILGDMQQNKRADVNGDGSINMGDISAIEQIIFGK